MAEWSETERDERIRDRAYRIWVEEGQPHGRDEHHWHEAERAVDEEEAASAPMRDPLASPSPLLTPNR